MTAHNPRFLPFERRLLAHGRKGYHVGRDLCVGSGKTATVKLDILVETVSILCSGEGKTKG